MAGACRADAPVEVVGTGSEPVPAVPVVAVVAVIPTAVWAAVIVFFVLGTMVVLGLVAVR